MLLQLLLLLTLQLSCVPEGYHRSQIAVLKLVGSSNCNERQPTVATPDSESRNAVKSSDKKNSSKSSNSLHGEALPSMMMDEGENNGCRLMRICLLAAM